MSLGTNEDFTDWINDREYELMKLENEVNLLPANSERHSVKLTELSQLKDELQSLKERQSHRRSKHSISLSTYQETKQSPNRSTLNSNKKGSKGPNILVINESSRSNKKQSPPKPKIYNINKAKQSSQFLRHPRSNSASPWTGSREASAESSIQTSSRDLSSKRVININRKRKNETPKFEQGKSRSRANLAKIVSQQRLADGSSESIFASPQNQKRNNSFTGILKEDSKFASKNERLNLSHSPKSLGDRSYNSNIGSPVKKTQFLNISNTKSEFLASNLPERQSFKLRGKDKISAGKLTELLDKNQELKSIKDKNFDFADEEEEYFVRKKLNDCTRDKVIHKYKTLFYKSREIKDLLNEMAENSYSISNATEGLKEERDFLNDENNKLKKKLETTLKENSEYQMENEKVIREYEERVLAAEKEKDFLTQKLNEVAMQYEFSNTTIKNASKGMSYSAYTSNREPYQSQRSLHNQANLALEARIQVFKILYEKLLRI